MKKKITLALLLVSGLLITTNVDAMTEDELKNKLTASYTVNGRTEKVDASVVAQIERYLNENEVSADDCDYISGKIDEAINLIEKGSATEWNQLTAKEMEALIAIVDDISSKTSVKAALNKGGVLTIYNEDGTVFTKLTNLIKYTDSSMIGYIAIGTMSLVGLLLITRKIIKANA